MIRYMVKILEGPFPFRHQAPGYGPASLNITQPQPQRMPAVVCRIMEVGACMHKCHVVDKDHIPWPNIDLQCMLRCTSMDCIQGVRLRRSQCWDAGGARSGIRACQEPPREVEDWPTSGKVKDRALVVGWLLPEPAWVRN